MFTGWKWPYHPVSFQKPLKQHCVRIWTRCNTSAQAVNSLRQRGETPFNIWTANEFRNGLSVLAYLNAAWKESTGSGRFLPTTCGRPPEILSNRILLLRAGLQEFER